MRHFNFSLAFIVIASAGPGCKMTGGGGSDVSIEGYKMLIAQEQKIQRETILLAGLQKRVFEQLMKTDDIMYVDGVLYPYTEQMDSIDTSGNHHYSYKDVDEVLLTIVISGDGIAPGSNVKSDKVKDTVERVLRENGFVVDGDFKPEKTVNTWLYNGWGHLKN